MNVWSDSGDDVQVNTSMVLGFVVSSGLWRREESGVVTGLHTTSAISAVISAAEDSDARGLEV